MSARQARLAKRCKFLASLYCSPTGEKPGPYYSFELAMRLYYTRAAAAMRQHILDYGTAVFPATL